MKRSAVEVVRHSEGGSVGNQGEDALVLRGCRGVVERSATELVASTDLAAFTDHHVHALNVSGEREKSLKHSSHPHSSHQLTTSHPHSSYHPTTSYPHSSHSLTLSLFHLAIYLTPSHFTPHHYITTSLIVPPHYLLPSFFIFPHTLTLHATSLPHTLTLHTTSLHHILTYRTTPLPHTFILHIPSHPHSSHCRTTSHTYFTHHYITSLLHFCHTLTPFLLITPLFTPPHTSHHLTTSLHTTSLPHTFILEILYHLHSSHTTSHPHYLALVYIHVYICSAHSMDLRNIQNALRNLGIPRMRDNLFYRMVRIL